MDWKVWLKELPGAIGRGIATALISFLAVGSFVLIRHMIQAGSVSWGTGLREILDPVPLLSWVILSSWLLWLEIAIYLRKSEAQHQTLTRDDIQRTLASNERVLAYIENLTKLLHLEGSDKGPISKFLKPLWADHFYKLGTIAKGRTTITGTPEHIWSNYSNFFDQMDANQNFSATCLVPKVIQEVFGHEGFNRYCEKSYQFVATRPRSQIRKLFIVERETLENASLEGLKCLRSHFEKARKAAVQHPGRLAFKVILWSDLGSPDNVLGSDFMIWGNELLAKGSMQQNRTLQGADLSVDKSEIDHAQSDFDLFFKRGTDLTAWMKDVLTKYERQKPTA